MASSPTRTEVGFSQLVHGSPAALPAGTRPLAIAPPAAPRKNGVTTDEIAKTAPAARRPESPAATGRKAKAAPRRTIPRAASVSGTKRVDMIAAKAGGKAVQRMTRSKMSQVWFASQTGPIASAMSARGAAPRGDPPATRSQKPAPKSAPPKTA